MSRRSASPLISPSGELRLERPSSLRTAKTEKVSRSKPLYLYSSFIAFALPAVLAVYFGLQIHVVTSASMKPAIAPGAVLITHLNSAKDVKVGQVILVFNGAAQTMEAHRVITTSQKDNLVSFGTKGDANPVADPIAVQPAMMKVQTVMTVIPSFGYVLSWTQSSAGKAVGLILFAFVIFLVSLTLRKRHDPGNFDSVITQITPKREVENV